MKQLGFLVDALSRKSSVRYRRVDSVEYRR